MNEIRRFLKQKEIMLKVQCQENSISTKDTYILNYKIIFFLFQPYAHQLINLNLINQNL